MNNIIYPMILRKWNQEKKKVYQELVDRDSQTSGHLQTQH